MKNKWPRLILRGGHRPPQRPRQKNMRKLHGHDKDDKMPFLLICAFASTKTSAQRQAWVGVHSKNYGLVVIQPEPKLFDMHELISKNWIFQTDPDKLFWPLTANLANQSCQVLKHQVDASKLVKPTRLTQWMRTKQEILGFVDQRPTPGMRNNEAQTLLLALRSANSEKERRTHLETFKIDHLPAERD